VGNIDNANPPSNKILVGSFQGFARIYTPQARPFRNEDIMIEKDFGGPILQLDISQGLANLQNGGGVISNDSQNCIAIL